MAKKSRKVQQPSRGVPPPENAGTLAEARSGDRASVAIVCAVLAAVVLVIYGKVGSLGFVNLDDGLYVTHNDHVQAGLSWQNIRWAFSTMDAANWHPLTWLSHMLDVQLFGVRAGIHHWVSVLFHMANSILLFLVLRSATGRHLPSAGVALLFVAHPLHVESVAWISERKDVLSTLFWLLATAAYLAYARHPSTVRYLGVLIAFALGLMTKPMLVTLPLTLLLLDYWPLGRFRTRGDSPDSSVWLRLLAEKAPLFALSAASSVLTIWAQSADRAVTPMEVLPLFARVGNTLVSYVRYLKMAAFPAHLAVLYPHPWASWPLWQVAGAAAFLAAVSLWVLRERKAAPYLAVGWFWYLVTLLPVIGLIQVGMQALADRYTYVPLTGIFVVAVWGASDVCDRMRVGRPWRIAALAAVLVPLAITARAQVGLWSDSITLLEHSLEVTGANPLIDTDLGAALSDAGRETEAIEHHLAAIRANPSDAAPYYNLGNSLLALGRVEEAEAEFRKALLTPGPASAQAMARYNLASALIRLGRPGEALPVLDTALSRDPSDVKALAGKGNALAAMHRPSEALACFDRAVALSPYDADIYYNLGNALVDLGRPEDAVAQYQRALELWSDAKLHWRAIALNPGEAAVYYNLGNALASLGRTEEAISQYRKALEVKGTTKVRQDINFNFANALIQLGRPDDALRRYDAALDLDPDDVRALVNKGNTLAMLGRQPEALDLFRRATLVDPGNPEHFINMGNALAALKRNAEAREAYLEALHLNPSSAVAQRNLAIVSQRMGVHPEAR